MKSSENEDVITLSKFDVAERQLHQAIKMFFLEEDPVSVRTLVEAASQVLFDIGKKIGEKGFIRDPERIHPEYRKKWNSAIAETRNFLKHADRDPEASHDFKPSTNDMVILDAIFMYGSFSKKWSTECTVFFRWFGLKYPHLLTDSPGNENIFKWVKSGAFDANNKPFFYEAIEFIKLNENKIAL